VTGGPRPDEERRKLFRRMEWIYVYAPPLLAILVAAAGGLLLATFVRVPGTTFWGRWGMAVGLVLGVPVLVYAVKQWWVGR
jgi:hypothetical protein